MRCSRMVMTVLLLALSLAGVARASDLTAAGPLVITAETLTADRKTGEAVFEGRVKAVNEEMTLTASRMRVLYAEDGGLERIEAEGGVRLVRDAQILSADHAVYEARERTITFTGNPRAVDGRNILAGSSMLYLLDEDRFMVRDSRVVIEGTRP